MELENEVERLRGQVQELQEKVGWLEDRFRPAKDLPVRIYDNLPKKWPAEVKTITRPFRAVELAPGHLWDITECLREWLEQHRDWANSDDLMNQETYDRRAEFLPLLEEINRLMAD